MKPSMTPVWTLFEQFSVAASGALRLKFLSPMRSAHACKTSPAAIGIDVEISWLHLVTTDADLLDSIPAADVFGVGDRFKMVDIPACTVFAKMIQFFTRWNWSSFDHPSDDMCQSILPLKTKDSIPILVESAGPYKAVPNADGFCAKSIGSTWPAWHIPSGRIS